jgi:hypothetical protein
VDLAALWVSPSFVGFLETSSQSILESTDYRFGCAGSNHQCRFGFVVAVVVGRIQVRIL